MGQTCARETREESKAGAERPEARAAFALSSRSLAAGSASNADRTNLFYQTLSQPMPSLTGGEPPRLACTTSLHSVPLRAGWR